MRSVPSKAVEAVVALLLPPACREEVLGDLHERYGSPRQYGVDVLRTLPLVLVSRIRRTADPQVLLMQAFGLYLSFLGAAWFKDGALLREQWGLVRLAIPAAMALLGVMLADAYAKPGALSALKRVQGPVLGLGLAFLSQGALSASSPDLAVPSWIMFYGGAMSLLLACAVRMLFPPVTNQLQGVSAPAYWLKRTSEPVGNPHVVIYVAILATVILGIWMGGFSPALKPRLVGALLVVLVSYHLWKRIS
jgi:hypothetical protein